MQRPPLLLPTLLLLAASLSAQTCGTPGTGGLVPEVLLPSNLWDSSGTFELRDGLPGAPWIWAIDQSPGPYVAPFGNLCLGFTPGFFILFDAVSGGAPPLDPNGFTVYTVDSAQPAADVYLTTIDWSTGAISGSLLLPGASGNLYAEGGIGTTPDGHYLYVALQADSTLRVLDASSQAVISTLFLASNGDPNRICVERRR